MARDEASPLPGDLLLRAVGGRHTVRAEPPPGGLDRGAGQAAIENGCKAPTYVDDGPTS
jgi:hypothetical protein